MKTEDQAAWLQACNHWSASWSPGKSLGKFMFEASLAHRDAQPVTDKVRESQYKVCAFEWLDKTEWVQERKTWPFRTLGLHRADVMTKYIKHLEDRQPINEQLLEAAKFVIARFSGGDYSFSQGHAVDRLNKAIAAAEKLKRGTV